MTDQTKTEQKLKYLCQLCEELEYREDFNCRHQQDFLLDQIDRQKAVILKTIVEQKLKEIENE
jgi:predicted DNA-binding protein